jgi:hypothetical protein
MDFQKPQNLKKSRSKKKLVLLAAVILIIIAIGLFFLLVGKTLIRNIFVPPSSVDVYGGYTGLKSATGQNINVTFFGKITSMTSDSITDNNANFPTNGVLEGKLLMPDYNNQHAGAPAGYWYRIVTNTKNTIYTNPIDGNVLAQARVGDAYETTGVFTTEKIGNQWWFIDPLGNAFFSKAVDGVGTYSGSEMVPFNGIFIVNSTSASTPNLGMSFYYGEGNQSETLANINDTIYIGSTIPFVDSYVLMKQLGIGGQIKWYYSTSNSVTHWKLINGNGNPGAFYNGTAVSTSSTSYDFNTGGYTGYSSTGIFDLASDPKANYVFWWGQELSPSNVPSDFSPIALPIDNVPRYYIKGVVTSSFSTPPIIYQLDYYVQQYVAEEFKYENSSNPGYSWAKETTAYLKNWGFNSAGQYSAGYQAYYVIGGYGDTNGDQPTNYSTTYQNDSLSTLHLLGISQYFGGIGTSPWYVKGVFDGAVCPGTNDYLYQSGTADVFDVNFIPYMNNLAKEIGDSLNNPWVYGIMTDDADNTAGLDVGTPNIGFLILSANPYRARSADYGESYPNPIFYAKYALRDFLRYEYRATGDPIAPPNLLNGTFPQYTYNQTPTGYELEALQNLNNAWGTSFTTWGTSSGNLTTGTNAYGTGTGFMDENGTHLSSDCNINNGQDIDPGYPAVNNDTLTFEKYFAERYAYVIYHALRNITNEPIVLPLYDPTNATVIGVRNYSNIIWATPPNASDVERIYNLYGKPLLVADYAETSNNTPNGVGGIINYIQFNSITDTTYVNFTGISYTSSSALPSMYFPDAPSYNLSNPSCINNTATPISAHITSMVFQGDYAKCVTPGQPIQIFIGNPLNGHLSTQSGRAAFIIDYLNGMINATGNDGSHFVIGWEHWEYWDDGLTLADAISTVLGNGYDGVQDKVTAGKDAFGRSIGGETENYGNLLGPLSTYLNCIYSKLAAGSQCINSYTITFTENGLPSGTDWEIALGKQGLQLVGNQSSTTNTISFSEPVGIYVYNSTSNGYLVYPRPSAQDLYEFGIYYSYATPYHIVNLTNSSVNVNVFFSAVAPTVTTTSTSTTTTTSTSTTSIFGFVPVFTEAECTLSTDGSSIGATSAMLTTSKPNDTIIIFISYDRVGTTFSVSDTAGLAWHLRGTTNIGSATADVLEYYAFSPHVLSNDIITTTAMGGSAPNEKIITVGISGVNATNPFDPNSDLPLLLNQQYIVGSITGTVSTSNANDIILNYMIVSIPTGGSQVFTYPSGFSQTNYITTNYITGGETASLSNKTVTALLASAPLTTSWSGGGAPAGIIDALQQCLFSAPTTTVPTTTIVSSSSGGSGSSGGGGGGSSVPLVTYSNQCAVISNIAVPNTFSFHLGSVQFNGLADNYVGSNYTSVIFNGSTYTLDLNKTEELNSSLYMKLLNVSYLPIEHSVEIQACPSALGNAASPTTTIPAAIGSHNYINDYNINITNDVITSTPIDNSTSGTQFVLIKNTSSLPALPENITNIYTISVMSPYTTPAIPDPQSLNATLGINVNYPCTISSSLIKPLLLYKSGWTEITPFSVNSAQCSVSANVPPISIFSITEGNGIVSNVVIGLLATTSSTSTSIGTTTTIPQKQTGTTTYILVAAAIILAAVAVILILYVHYLHRKRAKPPERPQEKLQLDVVIENKEER